MAKTSTKYNYNFPEIQWEKLTPMNNEYEAIKQNALEITRLMLDNKKNKQETIKWFKKQSNNTMVSYLQAAEDWRFMTVGQYYFILNRGGLFNDKSMEWLNNKINEIIKFGKKNIEIKNKTPIKTKIDPKLQEKNMGKDIALALEDLILEDIFEKNINSAYTLLHNQKPSPQILKYTIEKLENIVNELDNLSNDEIFEGYYNLKSFKKYQKLYKDMLNIVQTYSINAKTHRKNNRKKHNKKYNTRLKIEKITNKIHYKKEDNDLHLVSINPENIINAKGLLVYNTKTRKLGLYLANDDKGLNIRGSTIINFDLEKSGQKILRKPKNQLDSFRTATLKRSEIILNKNIKAKFSSLTGRINGKIILLKTWK